VNEHEELVTFVGLVAESRTARRGEGKYNAETTLAGRYSYFMYDFPKLTISASLVYPSLLRAGAYTSGGRRDQARIVSDFTCHLGLRQLRQPGPDGRSRRDWGPTLSIGCSSDPAGREVVWTRKGRRRRAFLKIPQSHLLHFTDVGVARHILPSFSGA
jgi:hypothetical protein